ncbi:MAG: hypothetical protein K2O18_06120 [Oscillospiraceae bacterium]|nr:hypothetical protein [Oscillospiraceae bacterium]
MKKLAALLLTGAMGLCLAGCGQNIPVAAADGAEWDDNWVTVGGIVGVETPAGLDSRENNDTLGANGMYYATWSSGEAEPYVNEDGKDTDLYDAQVYLLLAGSKSAGGAEESAAEWVEMASERYNIGTTSAETYNGQEFTVITYTFSSETNPYTYGASAFGVYRNYAVSAEVSCRESYDGDAKTVLAGFLENCHYAA